jgi:hypothetical protein
MGARKGAYRVLTRRPEGKRPLGRLRRRWEGNVKTNPNEMVWEGIDWINRDKWLAVVNTALTL